MPRQVGRPPPELLPAEEAAERPEAPQPPSAWLPLPPDVQRRVSALLELAADEEDRALVMRLAAKHAVQRLSEEGRLLVLEMARALGCSCDGRQ